MKLNINIWLIVLCAIAFASCNYLDIVPDEKATEEDAFKNPQAAERYLYSCYSYIPNPRHGTTALDLLTGDDIVTRSEHESFGKFAQGNYTPSVPIINYWHDLCTGIRQCYLLKENIGSVPGLSQDLKDAYTAEADFLIAYYHFYLMRTYGPVILVKNLIDINSLDNPKDFLPRSPYDECVSWVSGQLEEVSHRLPARRIGADYGRATSIAALAIRARLLLYAASPQYNGGEKFKNIYENFRNTDGTQLISTTYDPEKWKTAAKAYLLAIESAKAEGYDLYKATEGALPTTPEPTDLTQRSLRFTFIDKDNTPEVIWAYCSKEGNSYGLQGKTLPIWGEKTWGTICPTLRQVKRFYTENGLPIEEDPEYPKNFHDIVSIPEDDINGEGETLQLNLRREPRFYAWIAFHNGYYEVLGEETTAATSSFATKYKRGKDKAKQLVQFTKLANMGVKTDDSSGTKTGYLNKKGANPASSVTSTGLKLAEYPWPVVRLGELYLSYAEACVECDDLDNAKKYLNYIRERAGIPSVEKSWGDIGVTLDKEKMRKIVRQERLIELYLENHNFWDLRRWGEAESLGEKPEGLSVKEKELDLFAQPIAVDVQRRFVPAHYMMPIPISEINKNPNLVQNPGYADAE
jgi:hypothetical protein